MTDSILRSYHAYSHTTIVPFTAVAGIAGLASDLLSGETQGWAFDATTYDSAVEAAYVGGPVGGSIAVIDTGTPANDLDDVPLSAGNLTNSSTSPKMVHHLASPYVRWSPHNYVLQSQTFGTTWSPSQGSVTSDTDTAPDGTVTADTYTANAFTTEHRFTQGSLTLLVSTPYAVSCYFKAGTRTCASIGFQDFTSGADATAVFDISTGATGETNTSGGMTVTNLAVSSIGFGWYRCSATFTIPSANAINFTINSTTVSTGNTFTSGGDITSGADAGSIKMWGAQICRGYNANPYLVTTSAARIGIPQTYDATEAEYAIWSEPAATNLLTWSEDFTTTWSGTNITVSGDTATAPDASSTADTFTATGGTTTHRRNNSATIVSGSTYTYSLYAKAGTHNYIYIVNGSGADYVSAVFDLQNGVVGEHSQGGTSGTFVDWSITSIGDSWYRIRLSSSVNITSTLPNIGFAGAATGNSFDSSGNISTNTSGTMFIWGAQLELGAVATSYIPTLGSTVTRFADAIETAVSLYPKSDTTWSIYYKATVLDTGNTHVFAEQGLDSGNRGSLWYQSGNSKQIDLNFAVGGIECDINEGAIAEVPTQSAGAFQTNNFAASREGSAVTTDVSGTLHTGSTFMSFVGSRANGWSDNSSAYLFKFVYVPRRVSDGDLPTWRYS